MTTRLTPAGGCSDAVPAGVRDLSGTLASYGRGAQRQSGRVATRHDPWRTAYYGDERDVRRQRGR